MIRLSFRMFSITTFPAIAFLLSNIISIYFINIVLVVSNYSTTSIILMYLYFNYVIFGLSSFVILANNMNLLRIMFHAPKIVTDYLIFCYILSLSFFPRSLNDSITHSFAYIFWYVLIYLSFDLTMRSTLRDQHPKARFLLWVLMGLLAIPAGMHNYSSVWPDPRFGKLSLP